MLNVRYIVQETRDGLRRAKLSFLFSVLIVAFLLILTGLLFLFSRNADRILSSMNAEFEMQVFISSVLDDKEISLLGDRLLNTPGVETVEFFSKEAAAREFQSEFGEDVFGILEENPLPSSFNVRCDARHRTPEQVKDIVKQFEVYAGVDEVIYQSEVVTVLGRYSNVAKTANWVLLVFVVLGSLLVMSNTVRLVILSRRTIIETMRLVGATRAFIRLPYVIEGLLQGGLGGLGAFLILASVIKFVDSQAPGLIVTPAWIWMYSILAGAGLGLVASWLAIRRFLDA